MTYNRGPRCTRCGATEQECAWSHPCCTADRGCSHFGFLDANGNEKPQPGRPRTSVCGTDAGYHYHRSHRESPCPACRQAHSRTTLAQRQAAS